MFEYKHKSKEIEFDIYRKVIYSDAIIPNDLYHPLNYKMATINSMCERILSCLENNKILQKEIVKNNNYKGSTVDKIAERKIKGKEWKIKKMRKLTENI